MGDEWQVIHNGDAETEFADPTHVSFFLLLYPSVSSLLFSFEKNRSFISSNYPFNATDYSFNFLSSFFEKHNWFFCWSIYPFNDKI